MECVVCGGTNFTKESGYFFCNECQTQSQEIKEHAFQEETAQVGLTTARKLKNKKSKDSEQVTSWECYNVIIMMLTEELINLGVDRSIKKIVKCLWIRYLEKLEVLNLEEDKKPKLPLINMKKDLNITYGIVKKKKRKKSTSSESTLTESTSRRERTKKKRALAQAQYNELSTKSKTECSSSLHNETLTSLKSSSEKSVENEEIHFNKASTKELKKLMSNFHLKNHKMDLHSDMKCHSFSSKLVSPKYVYDIYYISPVKIYCILYIALLIKKDPMQLGDLFRFLREGHLSFNTYTSLFPESYVNKALNIKNNKVRCLYGNKYFRATTAKLVKFLEVESYIRCPNLVELSQRYCKELNLPDDIFTAVKNVLAKNHPQFKTFKSCIPNYEGRVMSIIIFVLKLLYSLDGVTEKNLSNYAKSVNTKWRHLNMFDIMEWMVFINYRKLVISEYHFPSFSSENDGELNTNLFLQYKKSHNICTDDSSRLIVDMKGYKDLLSKIASLQYDYITHIEYPATLYPYNSHSEVILNLLKETDVGNIKHDILRKNFQNCSLDFLLRPMTYLWQLHKKRITFINGGLNNNWVLKELETEKSSLRNIRDNQKKLVPAEIVSHKVKKKKVIVKNATSKSIRDAQEEFAKYHKHKFNENFQQLMKLKIDKKLNLETRSSTETEVNYEVHCFPYERYWLYLKMGIDHAPKEKFNEYFENFSTGFKLVLKECARVIEQTNQDLYYEFQCNELYLIYCGRKYGGSAKRKKLNNLGLYLRQTQQHW